jgi:hypothetical protein
MRIGVAADEWIWPDRDEFSIVCAGTDLEATTLG